MSIVEDQIAEGRRMAETEEHFRPHSRRITVKPKKSKPEGHEAFLKMLQESGTVIEFFVGGEVIVGTLKHSDKYTVSVKLTEDADDLDAGRTAVIFKSAISYFSPVDDSGIGGKVKSNTATND